MIAWNCDFCGKSGLLTSLAGIIYCPHCHKIIKRESTKNWIRSYCVEKERDVRLQLFDPDNPPREFDIKGHLIKMVNK